MTTNTTDSTTEWQVPSYKLNPFMDRIDKANRRLEKTGVAARFNVAYESFTKETYTDLGFQVATPWVRATMTSPLTLTLGDFTFLASAVMEEAGLTWHSAPGQSLEGWDKFGGTDMGCDHCGLDRNRTRLYVVRNDETGELLQLGHNCIELYTGLSPAGLWALTYDTELRDMEWDDDFGDKGFKSTDFGVPIRTVLAFSYAHSDRGRAYISKAKADAKGTEPTVALVKQSIFGPAPKLDEDRRYFQDISRQAHQFLANTQLMDDILASAQSLNGEQDYGRNMHVLVAGENVTGRNIGVLASLVSVYARELEKDVRQPDREAAKGFIGPEGAKIGNLPLTVTAVRYFDNPYQRGAQTTFLVGYTPDNHCVVWRASKYLDIVPGEKITITTAEIKKHQTYQDVDQTVITKARIK